MPTLADVIQGRSKCIGHAHYIRYPIFLHMCLYLYIFCYERFHFSGGVDCRSYYLFLSARGKCGLKLKTTKESAMESFRVWDTHVTQQIYKIVGWFAHLLISSRLCIMQCSAIHLLFAAIVVSKKIDYNLWYLFFMRRASSFSFRFRRTSFHVCFI